MMVAPDSATDHLAKTTTEFWHPQPKAAPPQASWIVNFCTDPDTFGQAMTWLNDTYDDTIPIFNHPDRLFHTARDRQSAQLSGIDGLTVPRCVRFSFETADDIARVFEENGFRFPVLVRPNELQTGQGMKRIDNHEQWADLLYTRWYRQDHLMIQFEDSRTDEGIFQKARVVFIGGKPFLRHVKAAADWLVHNNAKQSVPGFAEREIEIIDQLEADADFMTICDTIGGRIGLDFCGADIGVDLANKTFVLFEANPSMSVFFPQRDNLSAADLERRERLQTKTADAFLAHLQNPGGWLGQRG